MAYAFNRGARQQPQQKADIFATPDIGGAVASAQQPTDAPGRRTKELPGAVVASTATTTAPAAQAAPGAEQTPQQGAVKAVRAASEQQGAFPGVFQSIQGSIGQAQQKLQDEANKYVQGAQTTSGPSREAIEQAIGGGESYGDIVNILNPQERAYVAPSFATDTAIEDAGRVQSDAGLREILSRGQGPQYSSGMAAFDVAALKKQAGFQDQLRAIKGGQQALEAGKDPLAEQVKQQRIDIERQSQEAAAAQTRAYLEAELDRINRQNQSQAALAKTMTGSKQAKKYVQEQLAALKADFIAKNPELAPYADSIISGNLNQFYTVGDITPETFMSADDVARFQGISGLLGMGGQAPVASNVGGWKDLIDINEQAFTDYLQSRFGGKKTAADQAAAAAAEKKAADDAAAAAAGAPFEQEDLRPIPKRFPQVTVPQTPAGQVAIDTTGEGIVDLGARQPTSIAAGQPAGAYMPGQVALDVDSGGATSGGSTVNISGTGPQVGGPGQGIAGGQNVTYGGGTPFPGVWDALGDYGTAAGGMIPDPSKPFVPVGKDILDTYQTGSGGWPWS